MHLTYLASNTYSILNIIINQFKPISYYSFKLPLASPVN